MRAVPFGGSCLHAFAAQLRAITCSSCSSSLGVHTRTNLGVLCLDISVFCWTYTLSGVIRRLGPWISCPFLLRWIISDTSALGVFVVLDTLVGAAY